MSAAYFRLLVVFCLLSSSPLAAGSEPTAAALTAVEIKTLWATEQGGPPAELELHIKDAAGEEVFRGAIAVPSRLQLHLPVGHLEMTVSGKGAWMAGQVLQATGEPHQIALPIWPAVELYGTVRLEAGKKPEEMALEFVPSPAQRNGAKVHPPIDSPRGKSLCVLDLPSFRCLVPIGSFDLRLRAAGFASVFRWNQTLVAPGLDLGKVVLQPGGSIVGSLVAAGARELPAKVQGQASLQRPSSTSSEEDADAARTALQTFEATVERTGFFHITGLAPGHYWLTASAQGFAPASVGVQLPGAVEAELRDALELVQPLALTVLVEPPVDSDGEVWTLEIAGLDRYRKSSKLLHRLQLAPAGFAEVVDLGPGAYTLRLLRRGSQPMITRMIELGPDTGPVILQVGNIQVEGQIRLGDQPLVARLIFGGRNGSRRIETMSNEEGAYAVELPEAGPWRVDVTANEPRINRRFRKVEIPKPKGNRPVSVNLTLPGTELLGRVVDEAGKPASRAMVYATPWEDGSPSPVFEAVDQDGRFRLVGLPAGNVQVSAEAPGDLQAGPVPVVLAEDAEPAPLELVLHPKLRLRGTLIGMGNPLPGARVIVAPVVSGVTVVEVAPLLTGADGTFVAELPQGTREVDITAAAVGWTLKAERQPVSPEPRFDLEPRGGTVEIGKLGQGLFHGWLLRRNGSLIDPSVLNEWAAFPPSVQGEGSLVLDGMAPGHYSLCTFGSVERCHEGTLLPGGRLSLDLPIAENTQSLP